MVVEPPQYEGVLQRENAAKILNALTTMCGEASFSEIAKRSGLKGNTLTHNLNTLIKRGIIEAHHKGIYTLTYKTPLAYIYDAPTPKIYLGLLGNKTQNKEPETLVALSLLEKEGLQFDQVYVTTSQNALEQWATHPKTENWKWITLTSHQGKEDIAHIDAVKQKVEQQLVTLLKKHVVIMDCTSATKPATIAYYELAQKYLVPLIYVYEPQKTLTWLIDKQTILKRLGNKNTTNPTQ
ncbi:MAG: winged helix-turn-helix domain-containing protein [Thermoprotei archaeon]